MKHSMERFMLQGLLLAARIYIWRKFRHTPGYVGFRHYRPDL